MTQPAVALHSPYVPAWAFEVVREVRPGATDEQVREAYEAARAVYGPPVPVFAVRERAYRAK